MHRSNDSPRLGWDDAFRRMAAEGDDELLDDDSQFSTDWDHAEWTWPNDGELGPDERKGIA